MRVLFSFVICFPLSRHCDVVFPVELVATLNCSYWFSLSFSLPFSSSLCPVCHQVGGLHRRPGAAADDGEESLQPFRIRAAQRPAQVRHTREMVERAGLCSVIWFVDPGCVLFMCSKLCRSCEIPLYSFGRVTIDAVHADLNFVGLAFVILLCRNVLL